MFGVDAFILDDYIPTMFIHRIYGHMHVCMLIFGILKTPCICDENLYNVWLLQVYSKYKVCFSQPSKINIFFNLTHLSKILYTFCGMAQKPKKYIVFLGCIFF